MPRKRKPKKIDQDAPTASQDDPIKIVGEVKIVPITDVRPNQFNYNKQSEFVFEKLMRSLDEFGFVDPVDVRSSNEDGPLGFYEIIGGEHRFRAAEQRGYKEIPVNDLGCITDEQAKKLCIVLNETRGRADNDALAALVADLHETGTSLEVLPYDDKELEGMIELASVDDLDDLVGDLDDLADDMDSGSSPRKETLVGVMGLLDLSSRKEAYLIGQFRSVMKRLDCDGKPIRAVEKMFDSALGVISE